MRQLDTEKQVFGHTPVIVGYKVDAVAEQTHIRAEVKLVRRFPGKVVVGDGRRANGIHRRAVDDRVDVREAGHRLIRLDGLVTRQPVAHAPFPLTDRRNVLHKRLARHFPGKCAGRECRPFVIFAKIRRTVLADIGRKKVFICQRIG
ncbi:hypothetical protein D3C87_1532970 [compost metagenome]